MMAQNKGERYKTKGRAYAGPCEETLLLAKAVLSTCCNPGTSCGGNLGVGQSSFVGLLTKHKLVHEKGTSCNG
jgi:hypothetical protein